MLGTIVILLVVAGMSVGKDHNAHDGAVDGAIENVDWHYSDKLCLDLLLVDCATHITVHEEQICGTDGKTYANHCRFVHAVCEFAYAKEKLHVQNHGPCVGWTPIVSSTAYPASSTMAPHASSTTAVPQSTVFSTTPTVAGTTTTSNVHGIIENVFCQYADTIDCSGTDMEIICTDNGILYPNHCEFAKAKCKIPTLEYADDQNSCAIPGK